MRSYSGYTRFPGIAALAPCVGAALIIYTGEKGQTALARVLSAKPLVFIGLISYSLYLWHWPLYVYAKYLQPTLSAFLTCALLALSVLAACISYRFIEQPFRSRKALWRGSKLFRAAGFSMAVAIATGVVVIHGKGLPQRYPIDVQKLLAATNEQASRWGSCLDLKPEDVRDGLLCGFGDQRMHQLILCFGGTRTLQLCYLHSSRPL
jgi:hypothetical protein